MCLDNVLKTVLSMYMEDQTMPLPFLEEVLICTQQTTEEEVWTNILCTGFDTFLIPGYSVVEKSSW